MLKKKKKPPTNKQGPHHIRGSLCGMSVKFQVDCKGRKSSCENNWQLNKHKSRHPTINSQVFISISLLYPVSEFAINIFIS